MRRRTALTVISAAIGGAVVPLSFASAPAAAQGGRGPQSPTARWDFDERTGTVTREAVSGRTDPVAHVFDDARYKPDSDPVRRRGVRGRALYFDGYSTVVTAEGPGALDPADGMTIDVWIAPYAYEHGIDGKPQALVNQHDPDARTGFLLGLRRFGQIVFQLGFGTELVEVRGAPDRPAAKHRWTHVTATYDPAARQLRLYRDGRPIGTAATPDKTPVPASDEPLLIGRHNRATLLNGEFHANMYMGLMDSLVIRPGTLDDPTAQREHADMIAALPGGQAPRPDLTHHRTRFDGDRHRPQFHMLPPWHWMNEPHAPVYFKGKYHIFYQHDPFGPYWGQIHWGHAVSTDLVHWRDLPMALAPAADSVGPDGIWSGSAHVDGDRGPVLFFTGGDDRLPYRQRTGLAVSSYQADGDTDLPTWTMRSEPVTEAPAGLPAGPGTAWAENFRDPFVWEEDGVWYQLVGSGIVDYDGTRVTRKYGGTALVHTARRPEGPWTYRGPLYWNDLATVPEPGEAWELPVLLPLPGPRGGRTGKHILLVSPWWESFHPSAVKHTYYWIGTFDKRECRFAPDHEEPREFDFGEHFTGPSGFVTPDGRSVLFSITQDRRSEQQHAQSGWAHNAGMPVSVFLRQDGTLGVEPIAEAAGLRGERLARVRRASVEEANRSLTEISGDLLDISAVIEPRGAERITLAVRACADGTEETLLCYDTAERRFWIDRGRSSLDPDVRKGVHGGTVELDGGRLRLRVLLDRSMLEAYVNGTNSLTSRVYPTRADATGLRLTARGGAAHVLELDVWRMNGAYDTPVAPAAYDPPRPTDVDALPNHDFATGDLTGWTVVSGTTFSDANVTTRTDWGWGGPFYQAETGDDASGHHLWGFNPDAGGDDATGVLRSATVVLGGDGMVDLLVSGGNDPDRLYAAVVRAADGKVLAKATGRGVEQYRRVVLDLSAHIGERVYVEVVDRATGGWGHINVDDVNVPVRRE
ncbi:GH32 C-terminal domain-containing protein [Streptomyces sp. ISL-22]|uniref:GH32 C-terminal domain-containing protein n=1 Tax=unclassified Streptomyces TaxID=2593676 RepID=UPI001BE7FFC1|nr:MULTISPECIES: GH32 C-terminal domain-containing protein [unclassified Streptomyces]MBT2423987.1 GH32 C-terminal domain-containing protein [Streptomyces sp. ISL-24]MBT2437844.1 GH32 C-terminal domain-containing protein [Streptomyces sp. ISL-22]